MKYLIIFCAILLGVGMWTQRQACEPASFKFGDKEWFFPATIKEVVGKHKLDYKPPGYYYKIDNKGMEVILDYHFESGDFDNESQPKEVLYPRKVHSYVFRFDERPGLYDSLQHSLEQAYNKKFILTKGLMEGEAFREKKMPFEYNFLEVSPCLTIGIEKSPIRKTRERRVAIWFMYNLSKGEMGATVGNHL
jgi:hypothetical protein